MGRDPLLAQACVLKGGFLLRGMLPNGTRRSTTDADIYVDGASKDQIVSRVAAASGASHPDDQVVFQPRTLTTTSMQDDQGLRLEFKGTLGSSIIDGMIDLGFSAALVPPAQRVELAPMLRHAQPVIMRGYTAETVIAEKYETIHRRGMANTRLKDYYDLAALSRHVPVDGSTVAAALRASCDLRGTTIAPQRPPALSAAFTDAQEQREAWTRLRQRAPLVATMTLQQAADEIWAFMDRPSQAARTGHAFQGRWDVSARAWI